MNANNANDGIEASAATGVNEATSLSSSQLITTAAEDAKSHDTSAKKKTSDVVFFYDSEDQKISENVTILIFGENITYIKYEAFKGLDRLREVDMSASLGSA